MIFRRLVPYLFLAAVLAWPIRNGEWDTVFFSVGLGLGVGLLLYPVQIQQSLLKMTLPDEPQATTLEEWPWLDSAAWREVTRTWHELGFKLRVTQVMGEKAPKFGITVSQLWERSTADSLVEISQTLAPNRKWPITTVIYSFWGDAERLKAQASALRSASTLDAPIASPLPTTKPRTAPLNFSDRLPITTYTTHNRPPHWVYNLFLHPQLLGTRLSESTPDALWQTHLTQREAVAQILEQEPLQGDLVSVVRAQGHIIRALWHERFKRGFILQAWRAVRCGTQRNETWGELETQMEAKRREVSP